ncbi:MAG: fibronectin type III domain-containing protein, partial [Verrucomicrobiae bacterium]|nr:fibronectin type III domain-containing protein [Verrucomicrobiae bacterium]
MCIRDRRGSAGATGYDIERASKPGGPWTVIATNISDADVAYRPLFSDTTARPGRSYYYRLKARNASGVSPPSNIVGPVFVRRLCFVDELQDFKRVAAKSDALTLNNSYNALYAEYLFRAMGSTNDWLTYKIPGRIELVKIVAFCPDDAIADLKLQVGSTPLTPRRKECRLPSPPGGAARGRRQSLIEYEAAVGGQQRELTIRWTGPAELDRVEIFYQ